MTAPALIALAHGSRDPRSAETIAALTEVVSCMRPDLRIEPAFLDLVEPSSTKSSTASWPRETARSWSCHS